MYVLLLRIFDCGKLLTGPESKACLRNDDDSVQLLSSCCKAAVCMGAAVVAVIGAVEQLLDGTYCMLLLFDDWAVGCEVTAEWSAWSCLGSDSCDREVSDSTKLSLMSNAVFELLLPSKLSILGRG